MRVLEVVKVRKVKVFFFFQVWKQIFTKSQPASSSGHTSSSALDTRSQLTAFVKPFVIKLKA